MSVFSCVSDSDVNHKNLQFIRYVKVIAFLELEKTILFQDECYQMDHYPTMMGCPPSKSLSFLSVLYGILLRKSSNVSHPKIYSS